MNNYIVTIGGTAIDDFYEVEAFLNAGDCGHAKVLERRVGGCIINAAGVMAALNNKVYEIDYLKENDEGTKAIINSLSSRNIDTSYMQYGKDVINCNCLVMKRDNEKTIYVIDAKRPCLNIDASLQELLNNAKYIYTMMNLCKDSFEDINTLKQAKQNGAKIVFDAGCQFNNQYEKDYLYELASGCFLNTIAYDRLKQLCSDEPYVELLEAGLEFVCVTSGDKGATCYTKDNIYKQKALHVNVKDSTGAGDSFAGCFISCLSKSYSYEKALKLASVNGAYACLNEGGYAGAVNEETLKEYANKNGFVL